MSYLEWVTKTKVNFNRSHNLWYTKEDLRRKLTSKSMFTNLMIIQVQCNTISHVACPSYLS